MYFYPHGYALALTKHYYKLTLIITSVLKMHKLYKNYKNYTRIIVTELQDIDIELIYYNQVEHKIEEHW